MAVDLAAIRRRYKPERLLERLSPRPASRLVTAAASVGIRRVLLDTTVYIHEVAGRLQQDTADLLDGALRFHSPLCIAEITAGLGNLHPRSVNSDQAWTYFHRLFRAIPGNRILNPDADILAQAGMIAGILARTQNHPKAQRNALFNDAAIYLTAAKLGIPVLTANRDDYDLIQQVAGHGAFVYYATR
jgi:predicted nucleic acid-binding protein